MRTETRRSYRADGSPVLDGVVNDIMEVGTFTERGAVITFSADLGPGLGVIDLATAAVSAGRIAYEGFTPAIYTFEKTQ